MLRNILSTICDYVVYIYNMVYSFIMGLLVAIILMVLIYLMAC